MKHRIKNCDFSVRFMNVAKSLGFTTVGAFEKQLLKMPASTSISVDRMPIRRGRLLEEIQSFKVKLIADKF